MFLQKYINQVDYNIKKVIPKRGVENNSIQILDVQGKSVFTKTINEKGTIDLSELNNGVYVINIGEVAQRIVKI